MMRSMSRPARVAVFLASLLPPLLAAQGVMPIDGLRACARDLTDPDHGDEAMWTLLDGGSDAAAVLFGEVRAAFARGQPDWDLAYEQVRLLGLLGRDAAGVAHGLVELFPRARPRIQDLLLWTLGEVGPYARESVRTAVVELVQAEGADRPSVWVTVRKCELGPAVTVEQLFVALKSPYRDERLAATERLLDFVPALRATPQHVAAMRNEAIAAWGTWGEAYRRAALVWERLLVAVTPKHSEALHAHANLLQHPDPRVRLASAQALVALGVRAAPVVTALAAATEDPSPRVAKPVIVLLGSLGQAAFEARPALLRAAQRPDRERVALAALATTERVAERQARTMRAGQLAVYAFARAASAERLRLAPSLAALGREVVGDLADELTRDPFATDRAALRRDIVAVLLRMGDAADAAVPALVWWAGSAGRHPPELLRAVLALLARLGPVARRAVPELEPTLRAWMRNGVGDRAEIAHVLVAILVHASTGTDELLGLVGHPSAAVRLHAVRELGRRERTPRVAEALLEAMLGEHPRFDAHYDTSATAASAANLAPEIRAAAARALAAAKEGSVEDWTTVLVLYNDDVEVVKVALVALTGMGPAARSALTALRELRLRGSAAMAPLVDAALRAIE